MNTQYYKFIGLVLNKVQIFQMNAILISLQSLLPQDNKN